MKKLRFTEVQIIKIQKKYFFKNDIVSFTIEETGTDFSKYNGSDYGCVFVNCEWYSFNK